VQIAAVSPAASLSARYGRTRHHPQAARIPPWAGKRPGPAQGGDV